LPGAAETVNHESKLNLNHRITLYFTFKVIQEVAWPILAVSRLIDQQFLMYSGMEFSMVLLDYEEAV
jgi:hypothetical protein